MGHNILYRLTSHGAEQNHMVLELRGTVAKPNDGVSVVSRVGGPFCFVDVGVFVPGTTETYEWEL